MDVAGVGNLVSSPGEPSAPNGLESMKAEDFFNLLITQLQFQDPFEPVSNEQMVAQIAQIRDMESSMTLTRTLKALASQQQLGGSSALIGKYVQGIVKGPDGSDTLVEGRVLAVHFNSKGEAILELDSGDLVRAEDVTLVTDPAAEQTQQAGGVFGDLNGDGQVDEKDLELLEQIVEQADDSEDSN